MSPYYMGRRVTQEWWAEHRPDHPPGTVMDSESGRAITDLSSAGRPAEDATTEEVLRRKQDRRSKAVQAAIADAMGVPPDEAEGVVQLPQDTFDVFGHPRPWLDGVEDPDPEAVTARELGAAMAEVRAARQKTAEADEDDDEGDEPRGKVGQGQAERFAESKGFVSKRNRPSQTREGRRRRYLAADVKSGHCTSLAQAAQRHPPRRKDLDQ